LHFGDAAARLPLLAVIARRAEPDVAIQPFLAASAGLAAGSLRFTRDDALRPGLCLNAARSKQVLPNLLTLEVRSSIDFASKKQNQSWPWPREAA